MGAKCGKQSRPCEPSVLDTSVNQKSGNSGAPAKHPKGIIVRNTSTGGQRGSLVRMNPMTVHEVYDLERIMGEGTFGVVWLGTHKMTSVKRAVKAITRGSRSQEEQLLREISTMKAMDHPHIIQLFETFQDRKNLYLAMELCTGGELFDRIIKAQHFTETQAATIMQQILRATYYIHSNNFIHRDLKPENFIFHSQEPIESNSLKLIDFGTATECPPGKVCRTKIGTLMYMAPQVLMGRYDQKCDVWSCGVIMYILLSGRPPFTGESDEALQKQIRLGFRQFPENTWNQISEDAKDLIRCMLRMTAQQRFTAQQALTHDWVKLQAPNATGQCLNETVGKRLMQFRVKNGLEKVALEVVAAQLQDDKIRDLRDAFQKLDENGDGKLSLQEMYDGLSASGLDVASEEVKQMFAVADADSSGELDYTEFLAATIDRQNLLTKEVMWTAFNVFDLDGDGTISRKEVTHMLESGLVSQHVSPQAVLDMISKFDENGDGSLDFEEFMAMLQGAMQDISGEACSSKVSALTSDASVPAEPSTLNTVRISLETHEPAAVRISM